MNHQKVEKIDIEKAKEEGRIVEALAVKVNELIMRFNEAYCAKYY